MCQPFFHARIVKNTLDVEDISFDTLLLNSEVLTADKADYKNVSYEMFILKFLILTETWTKPVDNMVVP